jgi:hypothetical protein
MTLLCVSELVSSSYKVEHSSGSSATPLPSSLCTVKYTGTLHVRPPSSLYPPTQPSLSPNSGRNCLRRQHRSPTTLHLRRRLQLPPSQAHLVSNRYYSQPESAAPLSFSALLVCFAPNVSSAPPVFPWLPSSKAGGRRFSACLKVNCASRATHHVLRIQFGVPVVDPKAALLAYVSASSDATLRRHMGYMDAVIASVWR